MDEDEAKRLVLDEFRIWCTAREIKLPALRSLAIEFYFDQLEADRHRKPILPKLKDRGILAERQARYRAAVVFDGVKFELPLELHPAAAITKAASGTHARPPPKARGTRRRRSRAGRSRPGTARV